MIVSHFSKCDEFKSQHTILSQLLGDLISSRMSHIFTSMFCAFPSTTANVDG